MDRWREVAARQEDLITREQLRACGVDRWRVRNQLAAGRWTARTSTVIATTTGAPSRAQLLWLGVLHARPPAIVGDLTAAELAGLRGWNREDVTVLLPDENAIDEVVPGVRFVRTRRPLALMVAPGSGPPRCRLEPAILHFAAYQPAHRTAEGVLAAAVQQRLTTPTALLGWIDRMRPLRRAPQLRRVLSEIDGGAQSVAELDVARMCRASGLALPRRQIRRQDRAGRGRWTDCEWRLLDGRILVLEVDGGFHLEVEHWEDDLARQRSLTAADRLVVRCSARELRETPERVARDLRALGVPRAA